MRTRETTTALSVSNSHALVVVLACLLSPAAWAQQAVPNPVNPSTPLGAFTKVVEARLGIFNSFRVFEKRGATWEKVSGHYIPMTADGVPVTVAQLLADPTTKVDRPELLSTAPRHNAPNTVVGRIRGSNPVVQWVYVVRKYEYKDPTNPAFNMSPDIALIGHHPQTGATAYYQYYQPGRPQDGQIFRSPMTDPKSKDFWDSPDSTARNACNECHSADPFIHSPYVEQVKLPSGESVVPSDPLGPYYYLQTGSGEPFASWSQPRTISSANNRCTQCHRIGTPDGAALLAHSVKKGDRTWNYNNYTWMPPVDTTHFLRREPNQIFEKFYKPDAKILLDVLDGHPNIAVKETPIEVPIHKKQVVVQREKRDVTNKDVYIVDSRMRASTDGAVTSWEFWANNSSDCRLVVYKMVGRNATGGWRLKVVAESEKVPSISLGLNTYRLKTPIPVKQGYYFGLHLSGSGGLAIPYSDDSSWAKANNPDPTNPSPLGSIAMLSKNGARPSPEGLIDFDTFDSRTYSFEAEYDLGAFVYSTFYYGADGWDIYYVENDGKPSTKQPGTLENSDEVSGHVFHHELEADDVNWYFQAPERFLRVLKEVGNQALRFELKQTWTDSQFAQPRDVMLLGGGMTLYYEASRKPGTEWTSYTVPLNQSGWKHNDGRSVSEGDFKKALHSVSALRILGEFRNGEDKSYLGNVWIGPNDS